MDLDFQETEELMDAPQPKRFKHQSYNQSLKEVHLPSAFKQSHLDQEISDNDSHFHDALDHWRQLNLAPSFIQFATKAGPLSASMPLLLHNWKDIYSLWLDAFRSADDEGLRALLDLLQKMAYDLRTTLSPIYPEVLQNLLDLLPRAISTAALTALLETFSSLFRYLLIPSVHFTLLEETWSKICSTFPKCLPEIQRAMAEVWGSVLRRMKTSAPEKAIELLASNVKDIEDACAWVVVYACKSVSQTLHTCTTSIFTPLFDHYLSCQDHEATYTLLRRSITALIHHVKNADQFAILGDLFVNRFVALSKSMDLSSPTDVERLRRAMEVIAVPSAARQGSRLTEDQIKLLSANLDALPIVPELHVSLLRYTVALFTAADMSMWLGPGCKFLQQSWGLTTTNEALSTPLNECQLAFAFNLNGCLAEAGWGGWKLVALPLLFKATSKPELIDGGSRGLLDFLARLKRDKKLIPSETDLVWRNKIEKHALARLAVWRKEGTIESAAELDNILTLCTFFSGSVSTTLIEMINAGLDVQPTAESTNGVHSAWVLGACMQALSKREMMEWAGKADLAGWTRKAAQGWAWSHDVLGGLVVLSQSGPLNVRTVSITEVYPSLKDGILSHSRHLRLAILRLLDSKLVDHADSAVEVLKRCRQGEEVSLDLQGVRERVLRIGRCGQVVGDEMGADLCARWLIAQLKVNLRPLWSPSAAALSSLSSRFGDLVWNLLLAQVQSIPSGEQTGTSTPSSENGQSALERQHEDDPWEEERSWRDPSAHQLRSIVIEWADAGATQKGILREQDFQERFDLQAYEYQLLSTLVECSSLVEKHNRDIVPHFLNLGGLDAASKLPKQRLAAWLTLFSKFTNPKALHATDILLSLYISLLSHPDRNLQNVALSCVFSYKSPHLVLYEDRIRALLDDTRWRDELTMLNIDALDPTGRPEVLNIVMRLLFGMMLERKGRRRGSDRRAAVLGTLAGCSNDELILLVDLMLRPLKSGIQLAALGSFEVSLIDGTVSDKQLTGFLTLLGDVLKNLGSRLISYWPSLLSTTINIIHTAQSRIQGLEEVDDGSREDDSDDLDEAEEGEASTTSSKITRNIRQLGLKRFADFFRIPVIFDFSPYMEAAFTSFISPRLPVLDKENTQAPSALLELFHAWTTDPSHIPYLVSFDLETLPKIYDCIVAPHVKPSVILRIFDIIDNLLRFSAEDEDIRDSVLKPYVSRLLTNLAILVERTKGVTTTISTPLGQRQIFILSEIAQYSGDATQASTLFDLFSPLLRKPAKLVPEKVKVNLIKIMGELMGLLPDLSDSTTSTYQRTYTLLSQLFQSLRSRPARLSLVSTFFRLANINVSLQRLAELLDSMNSYSLKRMDEPDFDRRMEAFSSLNDDLHRSLSASDWLPIIYNMLSFIQDPTELSVRNSASYAMRHFIDLVATNTSPEHEVTFLRVLYPGLKNGLRSKNELVRAEVLSVIAYAVEKCDNISSLQEMRSLLEGGDPEANFFNNILHVQVHRRSRALRRLGDHCDEGHLRSTTLAEVFVPLVGNYITSVSSTDHHLINDAILATGHMAKQLAWGAYYRLVQKYLKLSKVKDESERVYVRALVALLDNFHFSMEEVVETVNEEEAGEEGDEGEADIVTEEPGAIIQPRSPALISRIADAVNLRLLPSLLSHLEKHDATTDDNTRIPISIGIVTVAKHLPAVVRQAQITKLLTVLSQILRSKSQETRDLARDALNRIAVNLGPDYLPIIMRELRGALLRGPQLHILAYMVHSLMVHITTGDHANKFTILDNCVDDVAYVSAEVIFGESGKDVQAEDFKTKMREVRGSSSRGLDSFAIVARFITPVKISSLLAPIRSIMHETETLKVMGLVEEVLKRVSLGLNGNQHLIPTELIVLCHTLVSQNAKFLEQTPTRRKKQSKGDAIVQTKRQVTSNQDYYANNSYRFVAFGLDLLHAALRRNRFNFHDIHTMTRLESMVVVIGNTLYSSNASVLILGLRCAAGLSKCPLKGLEKSLPVIVRQTLDIIKQAGNTESELVQVAFKSLAVILRDGPPVQVKEKDLVYLLELLSPDLEEPSRQASVFTLLRAIVARKFVVPEIYDLMEKVAEVAVTSQSPQVQELCRGVLLQFLLDYPQGKGRLRTQMAFFAKNLSYVHESGRTSIMDLLGAVITKFQTNLVLEYADMIFVALVMVTANDDSAKCREMAAQLIKNLYARLDEDRRRLIMSHLHSWASQSSQPLLTWVSAQVAGFIVDASRTEILPYLPGILEDLMASLQRSVAAISLVDEEEDASQMEVEPEWQLPYHTLTVLAKVLQVFPNLATEDDKIEWEFVASLLLFPHSWVRMASCRLLGLLFTAVPVAKPRTDLPDNHPLSRAGMQEVARSLTEQLKSQHLDESLSLQIVKNLFYLGKCFYLIPLGDNTAVDEDADDILDDEARASSGSSPVKIREDSLKGLYSPFPWLFSKLSYQIKSAHISRRSRAVCKSNWSQQPLAGLRWFAAMASHMDAERLEQFLVHILTPIYRLTEDDTIRDSQIEELKTTSIELQDLVQAKVGTTKFANVYNQIRQSVLGVRRERKVARALQMTTNPEAASKRRMQRNVNKKENRKRKDRNFSESKGRFKRRREE